MQSSDPPASLLPQDLCTNDFFFLESFYPRALLHSLDVCSNVPIRNAFPDILFKTVPSMLRYIHIHTLIPPSLFYLSPWHIQTPSMSYHFLIFQVKYLSSSIPHWKASSRKVVVFFCFIYWHILRGLKVPSREGTLDKYLLSEQTRRFQFKQMHDYN